MRSGEKLGDKLCERLKRLRERRYESKRKQKERRQWKAKK